MGVGVGGQLQELFHLGFLFINFYFSFYYFMCMSNHVCTTCVQCLRKPEENIGSPGAGIKSYM